MNKTLQQNKEIQRVFGDEPKQLIARLERVKELVAKTEGFADIFHGYVSVEKKLDTLISRGITSEQIDLWTNDVETEIENLLKIYRNCLFLKAAFSAMNYYERREFLRILDSHAEPKDRVGQIRYFPRVSLNDWSVTCGWHVRTDTKKSRKATHGYLSNKYLKIGPGNTEYNLKIFGNVPKPEKTMPLIKDAENVFSVVRKKCAFIQNTVKEIKKLKIKTKK